MLQSSTAFEDLKKVKEFLINLCKFYYYCCVNCLKSSLFTTIVSGWHENSPVMEFFLDRIFLFLVQIRDQNILLTENHLEKMNFIGISCFFNGFY